MSTLSGRKGEEAELERIGALRELRETDLSLPACFDRAAEAHSSRMALISDELRITFSALRSRANRLAHAIIASGGKPGDRIAVLMDHDAPAVMAALAALKAGRIVVALNRTDPVERLRHVITDCEPGLILTDGANRDLGVAIAGSCSLLNVEDAGDTGSDRTPSIMIPAGQTAFLVYTSGSTGRPKAVMMTHRQFRRNMTIQSEAMGGAVDDRISLFGSLSSGQGSSNVWLALLNGWALCPFPVTVKGVTGLADWIGRHRLTIYSSSASIFRSFMATIDSSHMFESIRAVLLSSEPATSEDFRMFQRHFPDNCIFVHTLSASETGNMAWSRRTKQDRMPEGRLPIGRPSRGQELLILDNSGLPAARNQIGEIAIRSRYLSGGYWRDPELTAKRFSPVLDDRGTRQFTTGDLGRINSDGMLEFCGRRDDQIKIRGNRIAFGEIENMLRKLEGVKDAIVEAIPRPDHEPVLIGFITLQARQMWSATDLRRTLRSLLPDYMVPSEFVFLDAFPVLPTGKIDRQKLRQEYRPQRNREPGQQPRTPTETQLTAIWAGAFSISDVHRDDDFFALGGDSLIAAIIAAGVHDSLRVVLTLAEFAEHPILADLASVIDSLRTEKTEDEPPLAPAPRDKPLPLSFSQERFWKWSCIPAQSAPYTMSRVYRIMGQLNRGLLADCINELSRRHEILRTNFALLRGKPVQLVNRPKRVPKQYIDISHASDPEAQANVLVQQRAAYAFDIAREPLLRFCLIRLHDNEHWLLRVSHHMISDNMSWVIYFDELASLYEARASGKPFPPPQMPGLQYGDYAAWQRNFLSRDGPAHRRLVAWWKMNLSGAPQSLRLPFARNDVAPQVRPADGILAWGIEREVSHRLNTIASSQNATHAAVRLAVFVALLAADSRVRDVVVGMHTSGRKHLQLLNILGDFSGLMMLRLRYEPQLPFFEWLEIVRDQMLNAEAKSLIPYELLSAELEQEGVIAPEVQVIFHVMQDRKVIEFSGLSVNTLSRVRQIVPWGFTAEFNDQFESNGCQMAFDPGIYDPARVGVFTERYKRLLGAISLHPEKTMESLIASIAVI